MKVLDGIVLAILIIGAINWGLIGFAGFNLVEFIFGLTIIGSIAYILVGLAGLYSISFFFRGSRYNR